MRKKVFISGPISKGDLLANIRAADAAYLALTKCGLCPLNPILTVYAGGAHRPDGGATVYAGASNRSSLPLEYEDFMRTCLAWVEVSDALLRLPGESVGADREVHHARAHGVPVFHSIEGLVAYFEASAKVGAA